MKYFLIILLLFVAGCARTTKIVYVIDGDTVETSSGERIRLANCDAPEDTRGHIQPFGPEAKQFTWKYLGGQEVTLKAKGHDKYGRTIGDIYLPDGRYFNQMLIKAGLAWCYPQYSPDSLFQDELRARTGKIGLWAFKSISPYNFRHNKQ